ncbi:MAG: class I SAM-dependent methyltransferase [Magnetococcus sp. WYHC-3]
MLRIPEPELMEDAAQAAAYAEADFSEADMLFLDLFEKHFPPGSWLGPVLDLGCGPGQIVLKFAARWPVAAVDGLDGSRAMLDLAEAARGRVSPGIACRVRFVQGLVPDAMLPESRYGALTCNSLLHHLPRADLLWSLLPKVLLPGAPVLVMDLMRPDSESAARDVVARYAAQAPEVLRQDFFNSLLAAYTVDEVTAQWAQADWDMGVFQVHQVSDRHWAAWGRMPR